MNDGIEPIAPMPGTVPSHLRSVPPPTSLLDWFARNPRIGLLGTIASLVGIPLSVYLFFASQERREIVYAFSASPTSIVKAGQTSELRVFFREVPVNQDVSGIQVEIWNAGKEAVRADNILSRTVTLHLGGGVHILSAVVKRQTRSLVGFQCQQLSADTLGCSWSILERGDGGLIELIYSGAQGTPILVTGDIEGRVPIRRVADDDSFSSKAFDPIPLRYSGWLFTSMGLLTLFAGIVVYKKKLNVFRQVMRRGHTTVFIAFFLYGGLLLFAGGWILYHQYTSLTPFPL